MVPSWGAVALDYYNKVVTHLSWCEGPNAELSLRQTEPPLLTLCFSHYHWSLLSLRVLLVVACLKKKTKKNPQGFRQGYLKGQVKGVVTQGPVLEGWHVLTMHQLKL